jgi:hypothetical protein
VQRGKKWKYYLCNYDLTKLYSQLVMGQIYKMAVLLEAGIGKSGIAKMYDMFSNTTNQVFFQQRLRYGTLRDA